MTGWLHGMIIIAWNERGADLWVGVVPVSIGVAVSGPFVAESPAMRRLLEVLDQVMRTDATVLIEGETGSGKELVARAIERGAFTGALHDQPGWFEQAHGGTVFLDEVGETPPGVQAKLLRVLQEREIRRVGGRQTIRVDVRILAATNQDLAGLVQARQFREDLYHRLHVVTLRVPPLRERLGDLVPLARHFLEVHARRARKAIGFSAQAVTRMREHAWPGNVRELEHAVERAVVLARGPAITPGDLGLDEPAAWTRRPTPAPVVEPIPAPAPVAGGEPTTPAGGPLSELERDRILAVLERYRGNRRAAAQALGIDRSTLWRKLRRYETLIKWPD